MKNPMDIARAAAELLLKGGADKAAVNVGETELLEFNVDGGEFSLLRTTENSTLSLTALKENKKGSVTVNDLSDEAIDRAVSECLASADSATPDEAWDFCDQKASYQFEQGVYTPDMERLFARTEELLSSIKKEYPKVNIEQMIISHRKARGAYLNSYGVTSEEKAGAYSVSLMCSGHDGDKSGSFMGAGVTARDLDTSFLDLGGLRQTLKDCENSVHTIQTGEKFEGSVVFTPDCLADVLSSLFSSRLSDTSLIDGTSLWKDSLGQQVADERLTVSLLTEHPDIVLTQKLTGEGFLAEDYDVIRDGVLTSFMLSLYGANKTGRERARNSGYSLVIKAGDTALADIVRGVKKGLIVARFSGGSPASNGDFSGVAKNSFLIENGEIKGAVSETMISGNLADMLFRVRGISKEVVKDGSSVLPWMAVDGITISGK